MLKVKLVENNGEMEIKEYKLTHPFNLVSNNNETYYNLNSFEYKNIKRSFCIFYCKKINFSGLKYDGEKNIKNGKITDIKNSRISNDSTATQLLLFTQRLLFFIDEKNSFSSLKSEKKFYLIFY